MKFAFSDSPYLGCCSYYGHNHGDGSRPFDGGCWNDVSTHAKLIDWLVAEYPDGCAMSASSPSLLDLAPFLKPHGFRIGAWVKPFASWKPGINPGYCWEAVLFRGGRRRERTEDTVRDFVSANITLEKGTPGAKPPAFCSWVLDLIGWQPGDVFDDVFPGSGAFARTRDLRERCATELAL